MASQTLRLRNFILMPDECDRELKTQRTASQPLSPIVHAQMSEPNPSHLPEENMASPSLTQTTGTPISERHHSDPPTLWMGALLGSLAIHVVALGGLGLLLIEGFPNWRREQTLIPVEVIAVVPEATTQSTLTPSSTATRIPTPPNTPSRGTSAQSFNRQTSSTTTSPSTPANSQPTNTQTGEPSQFQQESPVTTPAQNQQPQTPASPTNPDSAPNNGTQPGGSGSSSTQNPVPPVEPPREQPSPSAPQGSGFVVTSDQPTLISNKNEVLYPDQGDKLATLLQESAQLSGDDLKSLGIGLEQVVQLKLIVVIETTGRAIVSPNSTQVLRGNISADKAEQLARTSVERLRFNPTVMAGQFVDRDYSLTLTINPTGS